MPEGEAPHGGYAHLPAITPGDIVGEVMLDPDAAISVTKQRENVREFLARGLVALLAATLAVGFFTYRVPTLDGGSPCGHTDVL